MNHQKLLRNALRQTKFVSYDFYSSAIQVLYVPRVLPINESEGRACLDIFMNETHGIYSVTEK